MCGCRCRARPLVRRAVTSRARLQFDPGRAAAGPQPGMGRAGHRVYLPNVLGAFRAPALAREAKFAIAEPFVYVAAIFPPFSRDGDGVSLGSETKCARHYPQKKKCARHGHRGKEQGVTYPKGAVQGSRGGGPGRGGPPPSRLSREVGRGEERPLT